MLYQLLASALVSALLTGASVWKVQEWRHGALEKDRVEQSLESQRIVAKASLAAQARVSTAQSAAALREAGLRAAVDGSRDALVRLSDAADSAFRAAQLSHDACTKQADSLRTVFKSCATEYRKLGEAADEHASDEQTLIDAWPRKQAEQQPADQPN